ncbi:YhcN/YlaJ family sporulation lipoprotein [Paenibacillus sp. TRM 82003]|nr:YhcN/YlaJ family sporulation lipoprotein [Paenibacillus sp. TRM 82003]
MRKQTLWLSGILLLALSGVAGGCAGDRGAAPEAKQADDTYSVRVKQTAPQADDERSQATVERLETLAEGINEVKHANCVLIGETAIVGIDVGGEMDRSHVGTIKYAVAEALRKDPVGVNAIVTADMDLYHRLQEVRQDLADGRPIQGLGEEMADIIGRIIPQMPRDTEQREAPPEPNAATQDRGAQKAEQGALPNSQANSVQNNRDFQNHPANDK